jgi:hypothetical protein
MFIGFVHCGDAPTSKNVTYNKRKQTDEKNEGHITMVESIK